MGDLTEHFSRSELECRCGCRRMRLDDEFLRELELLRQLFGEPMPITSGWRCPEHNNHVSSTGRDGPHTRGAVDVGVLGNDALALIALAESQHWTGIGVSQRGPHAGRFVHLDRLPDAPGQPRPWVWSY